MGASDKEGLSPLAVSLLSAIERQDTDALRSTLSHQDQCTLRQLLAEHSLDKGTRWPTSMLHYAASHGRHDNSANSVVPFDLRASRTSIASSTNLNNNGEKSGPCARNAHRGSVASMTPIMSTSTTLVASILEQGVVGVNAKDARGNTPLWDACYYGRMQMVKYLIGIGADVTATSVNGSTALHVAAQRGYTLIASVLLKKGAKVDATKDDGTTPLMAAAENGRSRMVTLLCKHGANVNAKDQYGMTALHIAAAWGRCATMEMLVALGADVNAQDADGDTPLHCSMSQGHYEACCLLLHKGSRPDVNNARGMQPVSEENVALIKRYHRTKVGSSLKASVETTV